MGRVTAEVWALLQERQDLRKADPSATWGAELLLDTEHTPLPSRSLLFPPRPHCAQHVQARDVARLPRVRSAHTSAVPTMVALSRSLAYRYPGPPGHQCSPVRLRRFRRQDRRRIRRRPAAWVRPWWAGSCSTGGPTSAATTAGCAAPSLASARAAAYPRMERDNKSSLTSAAHCRIPGCLLLLRPLGASLAGSCRCRRASGPGPGPEAKTAED